MGHSSIFRVCIDSSFELILLRVALSKNALFLDLPLSLEHRFTLKILEFLPLLNLAGGDPSDWFVHIK